MSTTIWILLIFAYLFIGGVLHGLYNEPDEEMNFPFILFWPILLILWIGDEFGQYISKKFNP